VTPSAWGALAGAAVRSSEVGHCVIERLAGVVADELGIDRIVFRRANFI